MLSSNIFSAPKLKGRPRKRRKLKEVSGAPNSPEGSEHESNSSEGSNCSALQNKVHIIIRLIGVEFHSELFILAAATNS